MLLCSHHSPQVVNIIWGWLLSKFSSFRKLCTVAVKTCLNMLKLGQNRCVVYWSEEGNVFSGTGFSIFRRFGLEAFKCVSFIMLGNMFD